MLLAIIAVAGGLLTRPVGCFVDAVTYAQHRRKAADLIDSLPQRRPADVSPETWEVASTWASIAFHNVCFSPEHVSLRELKRFKTDLERELKKNVDLETIDWIWRRLEDTGPHGRRYVERFESQFRGNMAAQLDGSRRVDVGPAEPDAD
jgi:hypothetical protein